MIIIKKQTNKQQNTNKKTLMPKFLQLHRKTQLRLCPWDEAGSLAGPRHTQVPSAGLRVTSALDSEGDLGSPAQRSSRILNDTWSRRRTGLVHGCRHLPALQQRSLSRKKPPHLLEKYIAVVKGGKSRMKISEITEQIYIGLCILMST